jgi:hypothetical protein
MRFLKLIPLSLISLTLASKQKPLQNAHVKNPLNEDFKLLAKEQLEKWHVPGIAISVVDGDETWAEVNSFSFLKLPLPNSILMKGRTNTPRAMEFPNSPLRL